MATKLYTLNYSKPSGYNKLYKYDVPVPAMPPLKDMENYGLPIEQQKFRRTVIPTTLLNRKKNLTPEETEFIKNEHHKRKNGVWYIIKGIQIYFTGPFYTYLNYWWTIKGIQPEFRYIQCLIFQFWDMVVRDENSYGCFLVKPRRMGGTEFTLFLMWEYITRVRNTKGGMQSKDEKTIFKNFKRLTRGNKKVIWFMRPIQKGSDDPDEILEFRYPREITTAKSLKDLAESGVEEDVVYSELEMGSEIDFRACDPLAYDNEELNRGILNEAGKLTGMSLLEWWDKTKPCYHYYDGAEIVGKCFAESTIEEIDDDQIEEVVSLCKDSNPDPTKRDANGRTLSGLYLLFINYLDAAKPDAWGFGLTNEAKLFHDNKIAALRAQKKFKEISNLLRKEPETLEDALASSGEQSAFSKDRITEISKRLDFPESFGLPEVKHGKFGNFAWANGTPDTKVIFIESDEVNGKFFMSQDLKDGEDNAQLMVGGIRYPMNVLRFRGGVDPYEHSEVVDLAKASKGGMIIGRMYDDNVDGAKINEGSPIEYAWEWLSKQPVCDYLAREEDPEVFFEDMLMAHVYYGTQMNVENNKTSIKKHFRRRGYSEYLMGRPESTMDSDYKSNNVKQIGTPATTDVINQYFDAIAHYVSVYCNAIKHKRLVDQLEKTNKKNRTKYDLSVAFGFFLLACEKKYDRQPTEYTYDPEQEADWFEFHEI